MARYIDADALRNVINGIQAELDFFSDEERPRYEAYAKALIIINEHMENNPSIDIVRCKECEHHLYDEPNDCKMCRIHEYGEIWEDDDFCSYGEREYDD